MSPREALTLRFIAKALTDADYSSKAGIATVVRRLVLSLGPAS